MLTHDHGTDQVFGLNPNLYPVMIAPKIKVMETNNLDCPAGSDVTPAQAGRSMGKAKDAAVHRQ